MIDLSPAEVTDLPVDQLALILLRDLLKTNEWNEYNYLLAAQQSYGGDALLAITEAMGWLRARTLIARTPGQSSDAAISVTRTGRRIAAESLTAFDAAERPQGGSQPVIEAEARPQSLTMPAGRKAELLRALIDEADVASESAEGTQEWCQKAIATVRSTLGADHPSVASVKQTRFSPNIISPDTIQRDVDAARKRGVKRVVALLKGAIVEVEMTSEEDVMPAAGEASQGSRTFVVHGHDGETKLEVARFIEQVTGEWPVILHEQADRGRTIIEKFEDHAAEAGFAVVLLTADDEGKARGADELKSRARQNVVLELGFFIGKLGRGKVVALCEEDVELPSDLHGVLYKKLSGNWKMELLGELQAAGIAPTGSVARPRETRAKAARAADDKEADSPGQRGGETSPLVPAFTACWRQTTDGMDAAGVMTAFQKRLSHPGYGTRVPGQEPPTVRFGFLMACDPLGERPSTSELRHAFCGLLGQPPIESLVNQLTAVPNDLSWRPYGGNGRLTIGAVLGTETDETGAPIVSAILNLHDAQATRFRQGQWAELILYVEPRDEVGSPAPPAALERWHERLVTMLDVPAVFGTFLSSEVGLRTYADPSTQLGVCLEAQPTIGALVDTGSLKQVAGSTATPYFPSYVIADHEGREPSDAAVDVLRVWCDYALRVDGYEGVLAELRGSRLGD